jgi:uncharacterized RmlC-like cupin family protein
MAENVMPVDAKLGPIGDTVIFENDVIRVWALKLQPGGMQDWHQHDLPYLVVPITAGHNVMYFADGRERPTTETPGDALWREPGIPHKLVNTSNHEYQNVLVEFKKTS